MDNNALNKRYRILTKNRFVAGGFKAKEANRYKYWKQENIQQILQRKKRCDKLVIMLNYNYERAWELANQYDDSTINAMIKETL